METRLLAIAAAALLAIAATGCLGGSRDKAGGTRRPATVVLKLADPEGTAGVQAWIDAVQQLSHGSLRIEVQSGSSGRNAGDESGTIADLRAGKADLATIPARAYDTMGVTSFQPLLAPFLVASYALERAVLAGDLPRRMLAGVGPLGVVGIALLPGPLQEMLSITNPMLDPADYQVNPGKPIAIRRSRLAAGTVRALGTTSADLAAGGDPYRLSALEQDPAEILASHHQSLTAGMTLPINVVFWPRAGTIAMNARSYAALSSAQRLALRDAASHALAPALQRIRHDERRALDVLCPAPRDRGGGLRILSATPSNLSALRDAMRPVYAQLGRDPATRAVTTAIQALKRRVSSEPAALCPGGVSPHVDAGRDVRMTGDITQTGPTTWDGAVASRQLGRGRLVLKHRLRMRSFGGGFLKFTARFPRGELRGCMHIAITPGPRQEYRWSGPGTIAGASRALRGYVGRSLRFGGVTQAARLGRVRGGFVTDVPTGLPCLDNGSGL
jgi:TRAP-type C4-dicarboxylate transport system substrate-binding protein